jgi:glutaminase
MEVNCESMAVIGATLANGGNCPTTLDPIVKPEAVRDVLSLLHSCGFYEYSGQFAFKVSNIYLHYYFHSLLKTC